MATLQQQGGKVHMRLIGERGEESFILYENCFNVCFYAAEIHLS